MILIDAIFHLPTVDIENLIIYFYSFILVQKQREKTMLLAFRWYSRISGVEHSATWSIIT